MNCEQIQPSLLEYSLRPSNSPDSRIIKEHLDSCELCRAVLEQDQEIASRLADFGTLTPATDMWSVVREKTRAPQPIQNRWVMWVGPLTARRLAAAAATVCVLSVALVAGLTEYAGKRQEAAVSYLVEMHSPSQTAIAWTDDPLSVTEDRVLQALEEGS